MRPSLSHEEPLTDHSETVDPVVVPLRHNGRNAVAAVAVLAVLAVGYGIVSNPYIDWSVVGDYFADGSILAGLWVTLKLTVISIVVGLVFAVVLAVMRVSDSRALRGIAWTYSFIFRGIPMIVLLILVGNLGLFIKELKIGVPFTDITFYSVPTQAVFTPFVASVIALVLVAAAYMAEIVRGGILSVQRWQYAAAKALGLNGFQTLRYVVLPQALRVIIPPLGNEVVNTVKATALVAVIAGGDLLTIAQSISGVNYRVIELLIVATVWYLIVISLWSVAQYFIERKTAEK
ncbi:amino acid ABC transporter permease [Modestobacter sp. VKM Ac-2978]|uniref:amino acid ABC transporter permease n=1 Tax=Modestobacter sp. VKM Ac-2978 TaxID=3004132 RepID=UPI0022AAD481|nr:amino acid ABC transporter permease [Modestobacter sp. VKM Ac-2978]MCZ2849869.1 amino acid ABC transporter permease [Modestobacter sp. VKM Ac-2978]